ncbi:MAG: ATP-dependent sacrificial sulfur transferase LarE [Nitrosopumilaceae archaeon]|nr:ATP-dependent sacrificial sulfur transferase LarE [Nitrosopumilaceae archaeon]NIU00522.1 ATP-dependent sacrificial sulfur transferase LarE [Nitrosopumilaceae archaeon]NIU86905.1 ATP-dependent sacrificial sulfur transferase LarE [Nitrosopumilaceae archaeon]NIV65585.1 ATP-dependent sacrificial sulfur transferase LarE [Nitrosopumilaceae archaeon]NIX61124.1 ATP-dependent sacrificial sulfur transferase LarE [Nitrosopumilaceae archaeon]
MNKLSELLKWFENKDSALIALSGGVDSALVAYAAHKVLGNTAIAVTADYKTLSREELDTSKRICGDIGIKQIMIDYNELENEDFVRNDSKRCYHCRIELGDHLKTVGKRIGTSLIVDGTNLDDLGDYRPGISALRENGIRSPLVETRFKKQQIRKIAKKIGLFVYDKPSNSCLASRIPWGQKVTAEKLVRIELAEKLVKQISDISLVRVRDLEGTAKIEVAQSQVSSINNSEFLKKIKSKLLLMGFKDVKIDPAGYRPGKINVVTK